MSVASVARWDAFLGQIEGRHREVITEAELAAREAIASLTAGGDTSPLSHQLMAVSSRLQELESRIIDTWHAKVDDLIPVGDRDREYAKGQTLQRVLSDHRDELEPRIFAELARQRFAHASATQDPVACGCGTQYAAPITFRITELRCVSCSALLVYEPSDVMRSVAAIGAHPLAQEAAIAEWRAMRAAERRLNDQRPPRALQLVVDYEHSQIAYWRAYLTARAQLEPELGRDLALEVRSRMEQWYVSHAEYEQAWVAAGRPRAA